MDSTEIRCSHCSAVIKNTEDLTPGEIFCPECGKSFELSGSSKPEGENIFPGGFELQFAEAGGVELQFNADLLKNDDFRSAMPRRCLRCGANTFLTTHVVAFPEQLRDCVPLEEEIGIEPLRLQDSLIWNSPGKELLSHIPNIEGPVNPLNLPIPFWVCDLCKPEKLIFSKAEFDMVDDHWVCLVRIANLTSVKELLVNLGGEGSKMFNDIQAALSKDPESAWTRLDKYTRTRLEIWYKPLNKEVFHLFLPNRQAEGESGKTGIIISNRRFIYRNKETVYEMNKGEKLKLSFEAINGKTHLEIEGPRWKTNDMITDRSSLMRLRRKLVELKFEVSWE